MADFDLAVSYSTVWGSELLLIILNKHKSRDCRWFLSSSKLMIYKNLGGTFGRGDKRGDNNRLCHDLSMHIISVTCSIDISLIGSVNRPTLPCILHELGQKVS